jgi:hypothetical protein
VVGGAGDETKARRLEQYSYNTLTNICFINNKSIRPICEQSITTTAASINYGSGAEVTSAADSEVILGTNYCYATDIDTSDA